MNVVEAAAVAGSASTPSTANRPTFTFPPKRMVENDTPSPSDVKHAAGRRPTPADQAAWTNRTVASATAAIRRILTRAAGSAPAYSGR